MKVVKYEINTSNLSSFISRDCFFNFEDIVLLICPVRIFIMAFDVVQILNLYIVPCFVFSCSFGLLLSVDIVNNNNRIIIMKVNFLNL